MRLEVDVEPPALHLLEPWHPLTELATAAVERPGSWVRARWEGQTRKTLQQKRPDLERRMIEQMILQGVTGEVETRVDRDRDRMAWLYARVTLA